MKALYKPLIFILVLSLFAVMADRVMGQSDTNGLPDIFLPHHTYFKSIDTGEIIAIKDGEDLSPYTYENGWILIYPIGKPEPGKEKGKEKEEEKEKEETEVCCNPQIDIYIHAVPSEGKFYVSLGWHSYCFGPPYVTVGIEVKSICGWQTLVDPHTKWPLPPGAWKGFELSPLYTTVLVDGRVECACGNAGTNSKSAGYGGAPLGYMYWLMKQFYKI